MHGEGSHASSLLIVWEERLVYLERLLDEAPE